MECQVGLHLRGNFGALECGSERGHRRLNVGTLCLTASHRRQPGSRVGEALGGENFNSFPEVRCGSPRSR
jgi:hypothetical protein